MNQQIETIAAVYLQKIDIYNVYLTKQNAMCFKCEPIIKGGSKYSYNNTLTTQSLSYNDRKLNELEGKLKQLQVQLNQQNTELINYPRNKDTVRPRFQMTRSTVGQTNQSIEAIRLNPVGVQRPQQRFQQIQLLQGSIAQLIAEINGRLLPQSHPPCPR